MNILYLSLSYVPSRRASSIQVMRMCQALAALGHQVTLITKHSDVSQEPSVTDDFAFYGIVPTFDLIKLTRPKARGGGIIYNIAQQRWLHQHRAEIDLVYSRDLVGAWLAAQLHYPVIFEAHGLPSTRLNYWLHHRLFRSPFLKRLVVISEGLKQEFANLNMLPVPGKIVVAHDASDYVPASVEAGNSTPGSNGSYHVGYVGHLYAGRGIEIISELAGRLGDYQFDVVGGTEPDIQHWRQVSSGSNLVFHGFLPPAKLAQQFQKMDVLLMPYQRKVQGATGQSDTSRWMSPMKMFEYMASGKPIISSDLPVLREVLTHERNALLVAPDDVEGWVTAVTRLISDPDLRQRLGQTAQQDLLDRYTWDARARKVLDGI
ncbi:MAG: glycosyltransferase family 4 protein [Anaerolineae bacterium]|nr:glycosyltransferase family 4 protein [Anaerolineae bacterium]